MKKIFFLPCLLVGLKASAQKKIDTDRPDQTESAVLVPKKYFQAEFGIGKENSSEENSTFAHPAFLLKYGLSKRFELRMESTLFSERILLNGNTKTNTDLAPIEIGTKVALFEEKGVLPKTSLIAHVGSSFRGSGPQEWPYYSVFRISCQHSITENIGLGYNVGAAKEEEGSVLLYTFSPNLNFGKRWYTYVEVFGFRAISSSPGEPTWQHALDTGLAYYISDNTKLDLSGGVGLGDNTMKNYVAVGLSFRIPVKEKYRLSGN